MGTPSALRSLFPWCSGSWHVLRPRSRGVKEPSKQRVSTPIGASYSSTFLTPCPSLLKKNRGAPQLLECWEGGVAGLSVVSSHSGGLVFQRAGCGLFRKVLCRPMRWLNR